MKLRKRYIELSNMGFTRIQLNFITVNSDMMSATVIQLNFISLIQCTLIPAIGIQLNLVTMNSDILHSQL